MKSCKWLLGGMVLHLFGFALSPGYAQRGYSSADARVAADKLRENRIMQKLVQSYQDDQAQSVKYYDAVALSWEILREVKGQNDLTTRNIKILEENLAALRLQFENWLNTPVTPAAPAPPRIDTRSESLSYINANFARLLNESLPKSDVISTIHLNLSEQANRLTSLEAAAAKSGKTPVAGSSEEVRSTIRDINSQMSNLRMEMDGLRTSANNGRLVALGSILASATAAILLAR